MCPSRCLCVYVVSTERGGRGSTCGFHVSRKHFLFRISYKMWLQKQFQTPSNPACSLPLGLRKRRKKTLKSKSAFHLQESWSPLMWFLQVLTSPSVPFLREQVNLQSQSKMYDAQPEAVDMLPFSICSIMHLACMFLTQLIALTLFNRALGWICRGIGYIGLLFVLTEVTCEKASKKRKAMNVLDIVLPLHPYAITVFVMCFLLGVTLQGNTNIQSHNTHQWTLSVCLIKGTFINGVLVLTVLLESKAKE